MKKFLIINFVAMLFACNISMKDLPEAENVNPNASKNSNPKAPKESMTEKINEDKTSFTSNIARKAFDPNFQKTDKPLSSSTEKSTTANPVNKPANTGGIAIPKASVSKEPVANTVTNKDGSTTEKITNTDGSTIETTHQLDDSIHQVKTNVDGSKEETIMKADDSSIETVTKTDGTVYQRTVNADGSKEEITMNADDSSIEKTTKIDGTTVELMKSPEGKLKQKTTVKKDGTKIVETSNPADKSRTKITTKLDGTRIEKTTQVDASSREITTMKNGTKKETITDVDGLGRVTTTAKDGTIQQSFSYSDGSKDEEVATVSPKDYSPVKEDLDNLSSGSLTAHSVLASKNILGLDLNNSKLTQGDITKAYRSAARNTHPDKNPGDNDKFQQLKNARDLLEKLLPPASPVA